MSWTAVSALSELPQIPIVFHRPSYFDLTICIYSHFSLVYFSVVLVKHTKQGRKYLQ